MKKIYALLSLLVIFTACQKEDLETSANNGSNSLSSSANQTEESLDYQIKDFVWSGLNRYYLYKKEVSALSDNNFSDYQKRKNFYDSYDTPEDLFNDLLASQDKFSFITDNYNELEDRFNGISGSTGMKYGFGRISGTNYYFGFIEYILPGTSAEEAGLERGTVFTEVNGQRLTQSNLNELLSSSTLTINVGKIVGGTIEMSDQTVTLTDDRYTENPVYIAKTIKEDNHTIGYLMYNSFIGNFDDELNNAFADFKAQGVTDLVLDLRYNGGGDVESAIDLANMITGQYEGKVFIKEQWNDELEASYDPADLIHRFDSKLRTGEAINSLNLNKVYILTSQMTASASELVINGLNPYIDVVQIGTNTIGKFQASVTLYDSPDYSKNNINPDHTYALQPLVLKLVNSEGYTDYFDGLSPDIVYQEDLGNMGTLGEKDEPLLQLALNTITGNTQQNRAAERSNINKEKIEIIGQGNANDINFQRMYIDKLPNMNFE